MTVALVGLLMCAATLAICLRADWLGARLGLLDRPDGLRKLHERPTPLTGGIAVVPPFLGMALAAALDSGLYGLYGAIAGLTAVSWFLGLVDDRRHLRPVLRLFVLLALGFAVLQHVPGLKVTFFRFSFVSDALFLEGWAVLFTLLCLAGLQNALNMADGKNGLATGLLTIWTCLIAGYAPDHLLPVMAMLAGSLTIVLVFNLNGRLFLGDAGAYGLSALVALLAIYTYNVNFAALHADVVALWFLVPVLDCIRLMVGRVLRGRSPFAPDRNHLHHLVERLMPWRIGLPCYLALIAVPALLARFAPDYTLLWAGATVAVYVALLALAPLLLPATTSSQSSS